MEAAAKILDNVIVRTPLVPFAGGNGGAGLWLKPEIHQPAGSFKVRGVYHAVSCMNEQVRAAGISTVSAGNTAKALAWTGRRFGVAARSVMPEGAPRSKIDAVESLGGEVVLLPVAEVFAYLKEHRWEQEPWAFVHPWVNRDVMIGHGTLALEILDDLPEVETVFVPVGGGGLMGGVGSMIKACRPDVRIVAVEPEGCPSLHAAFATGRPVDVACDTICDGVAVPYVTEEMFPLLTNVADAYVLVSEDAVKDAIRLLAARSHVIAEGSGALALAAAMAMPAAERGRSVALITGGSIDLGRLTEILTGPAE